jgi:hypothetical protein
MKRFESVAKICKRWRRRYQRKGMGRRAVLRKRGTARS